MQKMLTRYTWIVDTEFTELQYGSLDAFSKVPL